MGKNLQCKHIPEEFVDDLVGCDMVIFFCMTTIALQSKQKQFLLMQNILSSTISLQIKFTLCYQIPVTKGFNTYINDYSLLYVSLTVNKKIYSMCYSYSASRLSRVIDIT